MGINSQVCLMAHSPAMKNTFPFRNLRVSATCASSMDVVHSITQTQITMWPTPSESSNLSRPWSVFYECTLSTANMDDTLLMMDDDVCVACPSAAQRAMDAANDDVVLQAVLSFLDEHDMSDGPLGDTTSESLTGSSSLASSEAGDSGDHSDGSTGSATTEKPAEKPMRLAKPRVKRTPVRSDKRQRDEMIALREESLALQEKLDELHRESVSAHTGGLASEPPVKKRVEEEAMSSEESRKLRAEAWQAISGVHQKRREAAEQERDRLRALIKEQKLAYRRMRRYLATLAEKSHESQAALGEFEDQKAPEVTETDAFPVHHDVDFDELSRAIPTMFLQTSGLFMDKRLDSLTTSLRDLRVQNEETAKMSIEALESRLVPFDLPTTANAVWKHHLTKAHHRTPSDDEELDVTENCVRRKYAAKIVGVGHQTATARGRTEFRRYDETNRVVIIKSSIMDQITLSGEVVPQFAVREFQWTVIGAPRADTLRNGGDVMSQIEIFRVGIPHMSNIEGSDGAFLRQAMKNGCVQAVSLQIEFERQSIENILMQQLTASIGLRSEMVRPQW